MGSVTAGTARDAGRAAFARGSWVDAHTQLRAADRAGTLDGADLELLAQAAYLVGRDEEHVDALERAHRAYVREGDEPAAARCAMWTGMTLFVRGETARGGGWLARAARLLEAHPTAVEQGYLLVATGRFALERGEVAEGRRAFERAAGYAGAAGDTDLAAFSRLGLGQAAILAGDAADGLALLDELLVSLLADEVSPIPTGIIYCAVIGICHALHDVRRAAEWVGALSAWCERQPDLVPFRGECLVHRSEILQLQGAWDEALTVASGACARLAGPPHDPALAAAYYQRGELHRLRGELAEAERCYRHASEHGAPVHPGLALLRAARGEPDVADAALQRALDEEGDPTCRARLLAARVEVLLAVPDTARAATAAAELGAIAGRLDAPILRALHAASEGAVLVAAGDPGGALPWLRRAHVTWRELDAPYECARVRVVLARASDLLGDRDGAELDRAAARRAFEELGAAPDLERLDREAGRDARAANPGGLTDREIEVLRLVAAGRSNREVAEALVISEHTVARHVQNMFTKLGVSSRTAAAAYAFEHALV